MASIQSLRECVVGFSRLADAAAGEERFLSEGRVLLERLLTAPDWLPEFAAAASTESYRQYLLYCDPLERFSMVSFVWGPGQTTPVHNHTVWGLVGVLRGEEHSRRFERGADGALIAGGQDKMLPGEIDVVSPNRGDIHQVSNGLTDRPSISIHVYGANIGAVERSVFDTATGVAKSFVSGYHNAVVPNLWYAG